MRPSSPNIYFGWMGVLCFFVPVGLRKTGVPLKVLMGLVEIDVLVFEVHTLFTFTLIYVKFNLIKTFNSTPAKLRSK